MKKNLIFVYLAMGQTSLFGQPQQQQAQPSAFGAKPMGFGQPTTSTPSFGFGQPAQQQQQQQPSLFGQQQQAKPFGTTIFGAPTTSQPTPAFGTQAPATGFGFGTQQQVTIIFLPFSVIFLINAFFLCIRNYCRPAKAFLVLQNQRWEFRLRQQVSVFLKRQLLSPLDPTSSVPNQ